MLDLLDDDGIRPLESLKVELGMTKPHYLSYARLVRVVSNMEKVYPELKLEFTGISTPVDKQGKTPLDYVPNVFEAFKQIKKRVQLLSEDSCAEKAYGKENIQDEDGEDT